MDTLDNFVLTSAQIVSPQDTQVIVELGARDCQESLRFAKKFPHAKIFAFECNDQTLPLCRAAIKDYPNIVLTEKAVSDRDGFITFYPIDPEKTETIWADGNPGASSLFKASGKYPKENYVQKEVQVPTTRLDTFFRDNHINEVALMWMDIQGAELMALKSMGEHIAKVKSIQTEVEFFEIYQGQAMFSELHAYMEASGFIFVKFTYQSGYFGDAVYFNKRYMSGGQIAKYKLKNLLRNFKKSLWGFLRSIKHLVFGKSKPQTNA